MKKHLFLLFLIVSAYSQAQEDNIKELRKKYKAAVNNPQAADSFYKEMVVSASQDPVVLAYSASSDALMAKNAKAPLKRMSYLKSSNMTFDIAIRKAPQNIEIRFLRFSILEHLPVFLNYKDKLQEDKKTIIANIASSEKSGVDKAYRKEIIEYLLNSRKFTAQEKEKLKSQLN